MKDQRRHLFFTAVVSITFLVLVQYQIQVLGENTVLGDNTVDTIDLTTTTTESQLSPLASDELDFARVSIPEPSRPLDSILDEADRLIAAERWIGARDLLTDEPDAADADDAEVRERLEKVQDVTLFSRRYIPGDPLTGTYTVKPGDSLQRIVRELDLAVDWRLLQRINALRDAAHIRFGQQLKIVRGPFHVRVDKSDFRADIFTGPADQPESWSYVRSLRVGLGTDGLTPVGHFVVKAGGKVIDPFWTDPRSGQWYAPGDPENPIGDRWIGLEGLGEHAALGGYGFHGTIEPESIGGEGSLGCVRLLPDDIEWLYELLSEGRSRVEIRP